MATAPEGTIYNVQVTYKGVPDPEVDQLIEGAAEESGGHWVGLGYTVQKDIRGHSWDFQTRRDADIFVRKMRTIRGLRTSSPKRLRERDFLPDIKSPIPQRRKTRKR